MSDKLIPLGDYQGLLSRKIRQETAKKFHYHVAMFNGKPVQVANYHDETGQVVAQKVRFPNKEFLFLGDATAALPFGAGIWPKSGKKLVVTEGEIDAMSFSQVQGNKYPVVSIASGAGPQIRKYIANHLDYFRSFEEVVLMFDSDEPGRDAAKVAAEIIGPTAKIAEIPAPYKDANDMLVAGKSEDLVNAMWRAKEHRPEGIVEMGDILEGAFDPPEAGLSWPFETLTNLTYGVRTGEIYALGAGTGVGKTELFTQTVTHFVEHHKQKIGYFALEQMPRETTVRIAGKLLCRPIHIPGIKPATEEEKARVRSTIDGRVFLYDSFGANDWDSIKYNIEYLAHAQGVRYFFLDHLTALAANEDDERKGLDSIMAAMGALVKKLDVTIFLISHLATPQGTPHEEGGRVFIRHFRGSRSIGFWCHYIFGIERDQQAENPAERGISTFRVLKDRYTGTATGATFTFCYDPDSGTLNECDSALASDYFDAAEGADNADF
jgi:twinkle protein